MCRVATPAAARLCRRISKELLQGLWEQHGSSGADGLNIIAMALGLTVIEVRGGRGDGVALRAA